MKKAIGKCWIDPSKGTNSDGYTNSKGHRKSYEFFIGEIKPGMHIDHICDVRSCYNPGHLEMVTKRENARRAGHRYHCESGHTSKGYRRIRGRQIKGCIKCRKGIVKVTNFHGTLIYEVKNASSSSKSKTL